MTDTALGTALKAISRRSELDSTMLEGAFDIILNGKATPEEIGAFLMGLAVRGETSQELVSGARIMRKHARRLNVSGRFIDTCGTGGLPWKSLNTSTASAIVVAAAGGKVAKHGNRSVPPKTGSADVLDALGVNLDVTEAEFNMCLEEAGVAFMFARAHHAAMRHVAPVRQTLGIRTIFNLLGPLTNPANAPFQILGVYAPEWVRPMADALAELGVERAWVVHGLDGIDEISISGETKVCEVQDGSVREFTVTPADAGLPSHALSSLEGGDPANNALAIQELLDGQQGPFRDVVVLNAGAALHILDIATDLKQGAELAQAAIDSGKARETLRTLVAASNGRKTT
ncbi:MAG: anthranilate phosphoribosyltransferase [Hyphomonas sp.]